MKAIKTIAIISAVIATIVVAAIGSYSVYESMPEHQKMVFLASIGGR